MRHLDTAVIPFIIGALGAMKKVHSIHEIPGEGNRWKVFSGDISTQGVVAPAYVSKKRNPRYCVVSCRWVDD